jgi:hypothetical protein
MGKAMLAGQRFVLLLDQLFSTRTCTRRFELVELRETKRPIWSRDVQVPMRLVVPCWLMGLLEGDAAEPRLPKLRPCARITTVGASTYPSPRRDLCPASIVRWTRSTGGTRDRQIRARYGTNRTAACLADGRAWCLNFFVLDG